MAAAAGVAEAYAVTTKVVKEQDTYCGFAHAVIEMYSKTHSAGLQTDLVYKQSKGTELELSLYLHFHWSGVPTQVLQDVYPAAAAAAAAKQAVCVHVALWQAC